MWKARNSQRWCEGTRSMAVGLCYVLHEALSHRIVCASAQHLLPSLIGRRGLRYYRELLPRSLLYVENYNMNIYCIICGNTHTAMIMANVGKCIGCHSNKCVLCVASPQKPSSTVAFLPLLLRSLRAAGPWSLGECLGRGGYLRNLCAAVCDGWVLARCQLVVLRLGSALKYAWRGVTAA